MAIRAMLARMVVRCWRQVSQTRSVGRPPRGDCWPSAAGRLIGAGSVRVLMRRPSLAPGVVSCWF